MTDTASENNVTTLKILANLADSGVPLVLAGWGAANFYGCRGLLLAQEYEVIVKPGIENAKLLFNAVNRIFTQFGLRVGDDGDFAALAEPHYRVRPFSSIGNLVFVVAGDENEFDQLLQGGTGASLDDGTAVTFVNLQGLLMLKERQLELATHMHDYKVNDLGRLKALQSLS